MDLNALSKRFSKFVKKTGRMIDKHSPAILIGCGLVGFGTTVVLVAKEAPIARDKLDEVHKELGKREEEVSKGRVIFEETKAVLPIYAPAIVSGTVACGCILASYRISSKRTAALATAYEFANSSLLEYQQKVVEKLGEKKEREIRQEIVEDKIMKNPPPANTDEPYIDGMYLYYDVYTGRYFRANSVIIGKGEKEITKRLYLENWVPLNDFFWEIGIGPVEVGDDVGFDVEHGIDIDTSGSVKLPEGQTATIIRYSPSIRMY